MNADDAALTPDRTRSFALRCLSLLAFATLAATAVPGGAEARTHHHRVSTHHRYAGVRAHVIQCVAFAKEASDVEIRGNEIGRAHV